MDVQKELARILSAGALLLGFTSVPAIAKDQVTAPPKVEFDADGRVGVSDRELLRKLGLSPHDQNAVRFDLRVPDGAPVSGEKQNVVCRIIPPPRKVSGTQTNIVC